MSTVTTKKPAKATTIPIVEPDRIVLEGVPWAAYEMLRDAGRAGSQNSSYA